MVSLASWSLSACVVPLLPTYFSRPNRIESWKWAKLSEDRWTTWTSLMPMIFWREATKGTLMIFLKAFQTLTMAPFITTRLTILKISAEKGSMEEVTASLTIPKQLKAPIKTWLQWWARCNRTPLATFRKNKWCRCLLCSNKRKIKELVQHQITRIRFNLKDSIH